MQDKIIAFWLYASLLLGGLIIFPFIALIAYSALNVHLDASNNQILIESLKLTLTTSIISLFITLILGTPLAFILTSSENKFFKSLTSLIQFPIFIPPTVAGISLILFFNNVNFISDMFSMIGLDVPFSVFAVIIAQVFVSSPFYIRTLQVGIANFQKSYTESALMLGATSLKNVVFVLIPNLRNSIIVGALLSWSRSVGELGATLIFAGNIVGVTQTMPLAIISSFEDVNGFNTAVTIALISIIISGIIVVCISCLLYTSPSPRD